MQHPSRRSVHGWSSPSGSTTAAIFFPPRASSVASSLAASSSSTRSARLAQGLVEGQRVDGVHDHRRLLRRDLPAGQGVVGGGALGDQHRGLADRAVAPVRRAGPAVWVNQSPVEPQARSFLAILRSADLGDDRGLDRGEVGASRSICSLAATSSSGVRAAHSSSSTRRPACLAAATTPAGLAGARVGGCSMTRLNQRPPTLRAAQDRLLTGSRSRNHNGFVTTGRRHGCLVRGEHELASHGT